MNPNALDQRWMQAALKEAERAAAQREVPVGAVIVRHGRIIARGHNLRETLQDPTAHAEMIALRQAAQHLTSWRLTETTCYVTLEPCPMCAGALVNARVSKVVWGCNDPKAGAIQTLYTIGDDKRLNHRFERVPGVLQEECSALLSVFFNAIRSSHTTGRDR